MIRVILSGCTGQMGKVLTAQLKAQPDCTIVAGVADCIEDVGYPVYLSPADIQEEADLIIDFSVPENAIPLMAYARAKKIPVVLATTGLHQEEERAVEEAASEIAVLRSGNMSLGIYLLQQLVRTCSAALPDADIEIVETHHRLKRDAPSGTALMLGRAAEQGRGHDLKQLDGRTGRDNVRTGQEIGYHAIRGGTVVGEHSVFFLSEDEVIEVKHTASSKKIFANGAIRAGRFLLTCKPGLYNLGDALAARND